MRVRFDSATYWLSLEGDHLSEISFKIGEDKVTTVHMAGPDKRQSMLNVGLYNVPIKHYLDDHIIEVDTVSEITPEWVNKTWIDAEIWAENLRRAVNE